MTNSGGNTICLNEIKLFTGTFDETTNVVTNVTEVLVWKSSYSGNTNDTGINTFGNSGARTVLDGLSTRLNVSGTEILKLDSTGLNPSTDNLTPAGKPGFKFSDVGTYKLNGQTIGTGLTAVWTNGIGSSYTSRWFITGGIITNVVSP